MQPTKSVTVRVAAARAGSTPATWGQRVIWNWHGMGEGGAHPIQGWPYPLPAGYDLDAVLDAIGTVLFRHDALRTRFEVDGAGLRQIVDGEGGLPVGLFDTAEADAEAVAGDVAGRLKSTPFRRAEEWPVRMAVVLAAGRPAYLVVAADRLALDVQSLNTVIEDVTKACAGGGAGELPSAWQPLDEAAFEQSPDGAAQSGRAARFWRHTLLAGPASMFDFPPQPTGELRYCRLRIDSPALASALWKIRRRSRISPSALVLGATAVVFGQHTGHSQVLLRMIAGNRPDRRRKEMVGTLTSDGLFLLDIRDLPFEQVVRRAFRASGAAHQFAFCSPEAVAAVLDEVRLLRGAHLDLATIVNDVQPVEDAPDGEQPDPSAEELHRLAERTRLTEDGAWPTRQTWPDIRFFLTVDGPTVISLYGDTAYVPAGAMRQMLLGIEQLLISAACGEVAAADLGRITGVRPVLRDGRWSRCGNGWVDVAATREWWRQLAGGQGTVAVEPGSGSGGQEPRLVGYLVAEQRPAFTELHRAATAAVGDRTEVRAPDVYRWVAAAPADGTDPGSWRAATVLAESDGREPVAPAPGGP